MKRVLEVSSLRLLIIVNGLIKGISGGDLHAIKIAQHWSASCGIFFLSSKEGCNYVDNTNCKTIVCNTPFKWDLISNIYTLPASLLLPILRMVRAVLINLNRKFNVIVASSHFPDDVIPAFFHHICSRNSKLVVYCHGLSIYRQQPFRKFFSLIFNMLGLLIAAKFADLIFVINENTKIYLTKLGAKAEKLVITSNGIDLDLNINPEYRTEYDACFIGVLKEHKGIFDLINVWEKVCKKYPYARLAVIGGGPEFERVKIITHHKKIDKNISFLGWLFDREKYKVLNSSKIFIFPSYMETWGIAIAEAMACGLPVVAYNLPIYREVFNDRLITVPLGNIDAMAEKICSLLENPEAAKKIGEDGREFIKKYSWSEVAKRELLEIFKLIKQ